MNWGGRILALLAVWSEIACTSSRTASRMTSARPSSDESHISFDTHEGTRLAFDVSADERAIVFDLLGQLWTLPAAGGAARQITDAVRDTAVDLDPAFSPDGAWIVFQGDRGSARGIWIVRRDGSGLKRLTDSASSAATSPAWSPDGRRIAYVLRDTIRLMDVATGGASALLVDSVPPAAFARSPAWSSDGARIVFALASGRIMEVSRDGGRATALTPATLRASAPAYSPNGKAIAFFVQDTSGVRQVWMQSRADSAPRRLTNHQDVTNLRVRWTGNDSLLYSANGRLWKRGITSDGVREIPFTARVEVPRDHNPLAPVRFAAPYATMRARGFMGMSISPDGTRIGFVALGKLWLIPVDGGAPRAVATMPYTANGVSWSPDGERVVWSAGAGGAEDLYVTNVVSGATHKLTALAGREDRASWSPDGKWIAFLHWPKGMCDTPPSRYDDDCGMLRIRALRVNPQDRGAPVARLEDVRTIATFASGAVSWLFSFFGEGQEMPQWSAKSDGVIYASGGRVWFAPLEGLAREVGPIMSGATFVQARPDSSMVFVRDNQLWHIRTIGAAPALLTSEAALYPSSTRDGRVLYLSGDGLRLRSMDGVVRKLGWPLEYRVVRAPDALLIRGARLIDGTGAAAVARDILISGGRIARISDSGSIRADTSMRVIAGEGKTVIPGLIDLHGHLWDDAVLPGVLSHGVTTMREMGGSAARAAGFRDAIAAGVMSGPRLVLGGFQFYPGGNGTSGVVIQSTSNAAAGERGLELLRALGGEYVKMRAPQTQSAGVALVRAARAAGMRVTGHCAHTLPLVAAGISGKEHLGSACSDRSDGIWYDDLVQLFSRAGMSVVTTGAAFAGVSRAQRDTSLVEVGRATFATPFLRWWALRFPPASGANYQRLAQNARAAAAALRGRGVSVIPASDDPTFADALNWELENLVSAGYSSMEVIVAATSGAARALGADAELGTLEVGKLADLIILDGDPIADIRNARRIVEVVQGGRVVDRRALANWKH